MSTFLTTKQLAERLHYHPVYINQSLKDSVFIEGTHYIRPFGGRKILYLWEAIEEELTRFSKSTAAIPMANGGYCNG
ncbi:hypothetical protein [Amphritea sp. HPY]|uniref:hypothetical protein n=1 Tax=Amphritea sp. HPY TaxID=3421652 RepID=UPI003D7D71E7